MIFWPLEDEQIQNLAVDLEESIIDCSNSKPSLSKLSERRNSCMFLFNYSIRNDVFIVSLLDKGVSSYYVITFDNGDMLSMSDFQKIYVEYEQLILNESRTNLSKISTERIVFDIWNSISILFLSPILEMNSKRQWKDIYYKFKFKIDDAPVNLDLGQIFNLAYLFNFIEQQEDQYFVSIGLDNVSLFLDNLLKSAFFRLEKTVVINGINLKTDSQIESGRYNEAQKKNIRVRQKLLESLVEHGQRKGVIFIDFNSIDNLLDVFCNKFSGCTIQILCHYHSGFMYNRNLKVIPVKEVLESILSLKLDSELREDIVLDALTCSNIAAFKEFSEIGFKYVYFSFHDIDTALVFVYLHELYSGQMATKLGWKMEYNESSLYLHHVWNHIERVFYQFNYRNL